MRGSMTDRGPGRRRLIVGAAGCAALVAGGVPRARAHHGWEWADDQQTQLAGTILAISMAPPHPSLQVKAADGTAWQIDLGNPGQTERSGFTAASARPGDPIVVLGNRHKDPARKQMKAVRITVAGKAFDMYPERIRTN